MATSEPPVSNAEAEAFEEELVLEMEQVVTEEELMQGLEQEENVATQNEHMEEIVVEHEEEHDGDQHDGVRYQQSNQSHPSMDAHYEEVPATTTYEPGRPVTRQSALEQSGAAAELQSQSSITRKRFAPPGGAVASDAKVVVLMKSNASGGKPTFVKLEPVAPVTSRSVRAEFARALTTARKSGDGASQAPKRKRRMIPPIIKKDHDDKKTPSRRGRPRKSAVDTLHGAALKKPKTEPPAEEGEREEEQPQEQLTSAGRPKRTHKAPKRFGDYYEEPVALRDPATIPISGLEPEAEEDESEVQSPPNKRTSSAHAKKSVTADVVNEEDYDDEDYEEEEEEEAAEQGEQAEGAGEEEGEEGSEDVVKLQGKEYEDFVARELAKGKLLCEQCHRFFANQNSMNAHRFKVHHIVIRASVKCPGCEHRATTIHTLNDHCAEVHGLKLQFVHRKFNSTNEFQTYLDDLAATQNMAFVRHRKSANKRQLYCNRSGAKRVASDETIRNRPRKGSAKIGAMCPAHMFYTECDDGSVEVNGQITHFGHTLDPRFVFPVTSSEKVTGRMKPSSAKTAALSSMYGRIPVDLQVKPKKSGDDDGFINVETDDRRDEEDEEEEELRRLEEEERLEMEFGPVHPKAEEIDIRMKNIDRLCSFLFDNVSEQLYRLDDSTMEVLLRALRTTQNTVSNLNSMMIQIKEGDPEIIQKYQRRGGRGWSSISASKFANRRRQRQFYDTEDYDEDTVYYRHVPLRPNTDLQNIYLLDDDDDEYYEEY